MAEAGLVDDCISSATLELLELDETRHNDAAAEAALPRTGDDHGREGRGIRFVSFCNDIRAAIVGDIGDIIDEEA